MPNPYNPFIIQDWSNSMIKEEIMNLLKLFNQRDETLKGLSNNIGILANVMFLFGEIIARLTEETDKLKVKCDIIKNKEAYLLKQDWKRENPNKVVPNIQYFQAQAQSVCMKDREELISKTAELVRFKQAYDSYEHIMNALKKKMEAIK